MAARSSLASSAPGSSGGQPRRGRDAASRVGAADGLSGFYAMATGQIESGEFQGCDNLFVRYAFTHGPDWRVVQGIDHGFSQVSAKGSSSDASVVWNLPLDVTFKSTNAHGWPRLVISVYSQDFLGRYVVRGYGSVLIPTVPGRYVRYIRTFAPMASTLIQQFLGWLTGSTPEFYDSRFAASSEGREVTRVESTGTVRVTIQVLTRGMASHGFSTGGPPDLADAESEAILGYTGAGAAAAFSTLSAPITGGLGAAVPAGASAIGAARPTVSSSVPTGPLPSVSQVTSGPRGSSVGRSGSTSILSAVPEGGSSSSSAAGARITSTRVGSSSTGTTSTLPPLGRGVKEVESVSAGGDAAPAGAASSSSSSARRAGLGVLPATDSKGGSAADAVLSGGSAETPSSGGGVTTNEDGDLLLPRRSKAREGARRRSNSRNSDTLAPTLGTAVDITSGAPVSGPGMISPGPTNAAGGDDGASGESFQRPARPTNRPGATRSSSGRTGGGSTSSATRMGFGVDYGSAGGAEAEGKADR